MQRTENKLTLKQKKNGKLKAGLENFTEHRNRHYGNRQRKTNIELPLLERQEAELALVPHLVLVDLEEVLRFSSWSWRGSRRSRKQLVRHGKLVAVDRQSAVCGEPSLEMATI